MEEDIQLYQKLYLVNGMNFMNLDYEKLIKRYEAYLLLFLDVKQTLYLNTTYLKDVLMGFQYFQNIIFDSPSFEIYETLDFFEKKSKEISRKASQNQKTLLEEKILALSIACMNELHYSFSDINSLLLKNAYQIYQVLHPNPEKLILS